MLDLLWRTVFRWRLRPRRVVADGIYGTVENVAAVEKPGIRAYLALYEADGSPKFFPKAAFIYDAERDLYVCSRGETLRYWSTWKAQRARRYKAKAKACNACPLKPGCTSNKEGRTVFRRFDESYLDRVKSYRKALRKRKVWVEPLFAEAKDRHGMRRFRLRGLDKVNAEALLIAAGQILKRLVALRPLMGAPSADRSTTLRLHRQPKTSPFAGVLQQPGPFSDTCISEKRTLQCKRLFGGTFRYPFFDGVCNCDVEGMDRCTLVRKDDRRLQERW